MATTLTARPDTTTVGDRRRSLLTAGVVAGPLFVVASLAQIPFRDGFDLTRHAFSFLLIGPGGALQVLNYLLTGLLFAVAGVGLRRRLAGRAGAAGQILATLLAAGLVVAGIFPPPPSFGYPIGAPEGAPAQMTTAAMLHALGFITGVLAFTILQFLLAGWLWRHHDRRWAGIALATGLALLSVPPTSGLSFGTVWLYLAVSAANLLTAVHCHRLRRRVG